LLLSAKHLFVAARVVAVATAWAAAFDATPEAAMDEDQMFGAKQQVARGGQCD
jgi:hypothetical protein